MDDAEKLWFYIKTKDVEETNKILERKKMMDVKKVRKSMFNQVLT